MSHKTRAVTRAGKGAARAAVALLVVLALFAPGCRAGGRGGDTATSDARPSGRLLVGLGVEGLDARGGRVTVPAGRPVTFAVVAENRGAQTTPLVFPTGQSFDLVISRDGREVWRWSAGRAFSQAVRNEEMRPAERRAERITWPGTDQAGRTVEPGSYEVRGLLALEAPLATPPIQLNITPR
jgi:Intracellular proteinase inhibitor